MRATIRLATTILTAILYTTLVSPAQAGLAEILFDTRPEQLAKGGAAVPGAICGVAEVRQPTSLGEAGSGLLRINFIRERTLTWHRYRHREGGAEGEGWSQELIWPLDRRDNQARWYVGLESENFDSSVDYDRVRKGRKDALNVGVDSRVRRAALMFRASEKTSFGLGWAKDRYDAVGLGLRWRKQPQPPSPMEEFPFLLDLDAEHKVVAVQHQVEDRRWGLQYGNIEAHNLFGVEVDENNYWLTATGEGHDWQGYYRRGDAQDGQFMQVWHSSISAGGPTLAGNMIRGEHQFQFERRGVRVGRRRVSKSFESQVTFEYDRSFGALDGFIDTDLLPFPLGERQGLDSWGSLRTVGIRYGGGEQISARVRLLWGLSLLRGHGRLQYVFKRRHSPFRPMEYPHAGFYNANFTGGNLALGARYVDGNGWRVTGVVSVMGGDGHVDSRRWTDTVQPPPLPPAPPEPPPTPPQPPSPPGVPKSEVHPSYIIGLSIERRF